MFTELLHSTESLLTGAPFTVQFKRFFLYAFNEWHPYQSVRNALNIARLATKYKRHLNNNKNNNIKSPDSVKHHKSNYKDSFENDRRVIFVIGTQCNAKFRKKQSAN